MVLASIYAAPLFWPPAAETWAVRPDASLLVRLFPGVPPGWIVLRLGALLAAAALLGVAGLGALPDPLRPAATRSRDARSWLRGLALCVAVGQLAWAPWSRALGPVGQLVYALLLALPPLLLALPIRVRWQPFRWRRRLPIALVILAWAGLTLWVDLESVRLAYAVDGWRGIVDIHRFAAQGKNLFADLFDPELPGLGAAFLLFLGMPAYQTGWLPVGNGLLQVFQVLALAAAAAGVASLARRFVGRGVAVVAVAVFLFSPYTRFVALVPGPFVAGPVYGVAIVLCALAAARRRSEAALAALGGLSGLALTFPGVAPVGGLFVAGALWSLRREWRRVRFGLAIGLASFLAVAVPAIPEVITPARMLQHLGGHGVVALIEPALLGQLPVSALAEARAVQVSRPLDVLAGALLLPFAHPRLAIRLFGDAIFDPLGAILVAVGLVASVRSAFGSPGARWLLVFYLAALSPAFVSPVDLVDVVHAVVLPVPVALLAAAGCAVLRRRLLGWRWRRFVAPVAALAAAAGGIALFDVVNPRIVPASSMAILLRAMPPAASERVLVLDYPADYAFDARWLFTGAMTALGGPRPIGYLGFGGGALPAAGLATAGKDILAWSPGLERDLRVRDAVCRAWPRASLLEIEDATGLSRVLVAFREGDPWRPEARSRRSDCAAAPS